MLLGLGAIVLAQGLREPAPPLRASPQAWRAVLSVTAALVAFGFAIERLGLVLAILLLTGIGALATRALRPLETAVAAVALIVLSWAIFISDWASPSRSGPSGRTMEFLDNLAIGFGVALTPANLAFCLPRRAWSAR